MAVESFCSFIFSQLEFDYICFFLLFLCCETLWINSIVIIWRGELIIAHVWLLICSFELIFNMTCVCLQRLLLPGSSVGTCCTVRLFWCTIFGQRLKVVHIQSRCGSEHVYHCKPQSASISTRPGPGSCICRWLGVETCAFVFVLTSLSVCAWSLFCVPRLDLCMCVCVGWDLSAAGFGPWSPGGIWSPGLLIDQQVSGLNPALTFGPDTNCI